MMEPGGRGNRAPAASSVSKERDRMMKRQIHKNVFLWLMCFVSLSYGLVFLGCDGSADRQEQPTAEIDRERGKLLAFAFDTASAIPMEPHRKDRAKAQQGVAEACMETGQISRAVEYARKIDSWRRGVAMGELAFHMAGKGEKDLAESYLEDASRVATMYKGWRKDRIRIQIARTQSLLGQTEQARQQMATADDIEKPRLASADSGVLSDEEFDRRLQQLGDWVAKGDFDISRAALETLVELLDSQYLHGDRQDRIFLAMEEPYKKMPIFVRVDLLLRSAGIALKHEDRDRALEIIDRAQRYVDEAALALRQGMKIRARLVRARFQAGDEDRAWGDIGKLLEEYRKNEEQIVNIYRAECLRPMAEAYLVMGDRKSASEVYGMAIEAGFVNPNSRPRALDLSATCCSMAVHGFMPNSELWARMKEIRNGLSDPW
jgi:tetratricopeptide (TPR) repeat protein